MIAKDSEERYHVVVDYNTDEVTVYVVRGKLLKVIAKQTTLTKPSSFDKLLGATMEKKIRKTTRDLQTQCDELNASLEEMGAACKAAELPTVLPRV